MFSDLVEHRPAGDCCDLFAREVVPLPNRLENGWEGIPNGIVARHRLIMRLAEQNLGVPGVGEPMPVAQANCAPCLWVSGNRPGLGDEVPEKRHKSASALLRCRRPESLVRRRVLGASIGLESATQDLEI